MFRMNISSTTVLLLISGCSSKHSSDDTAKVDEPVKTEEPETVASEEPETISEYDIYDEGYCDVQFKTDMYWILDEDTHTGI